MNLHWLIHNRRSRLPQVTTGEWIELACCLSACSMVAGLGVAFVFPGMAWAALIGTIPAFPSVLAAHFHDWSREI